MKEGDVMLHSSHRQRGHRGSGERNQPDATEKEKGVSLLQSVPQR